MKEVQREKGKEKNARRCVQESECMKGRARRVAKDQKGRRRVQVVRHRYGR